MPCLVFLPTFLLFPPQRHLAFRLLSFTLGRLPALLLFPTQSGLTLGRLSFAPGGLAAFLLFAPQSSLTLGRWGLLTRGDSREALLKRAARFVSACGFGSLSSLFSHHRDRSWHGTVVALALCRGCRKGRPDQGISPRQHNNENGSCGRVGNDDASPPQPALLAFLLTFPVQQAVVSCSLLCIAKDFNSSCDLPEPTRGIGIARVEVRMVRLSCLTIRLVERLIVRIRTNTELIVKCSHR